MRDVEPQNENGDDDDSFNGDYIKSDQKNIYVCEPREKENNAEEVVKENHKRSPDVEDENVPEVLEIEVGVDALVTIGDQDKLIREKVDAILNNKSFREKKPKHRPCN